MDNLLSKPTPPSTPSPSPRRPSPRLDVPVSPGAASTVASSATETPASPTLRALIEQEYDDPTRVEKMFEIATACGTTARGYAELRRIQKRTRAEHAAKIARAQTALQQQQSTDTTANPTEGANGVDANTQHAEATPETQ